MSVILSLFIKTVFYKRRKFKMKHWMDYQIVRVTQINFENELVKWKKNLANFSIDSRLRKFTVYFQQIAVN